MTVKIALDVPEEHCYIGMVRRTTRMLLEHHRVAEQDIADLEVVIGELCANVTCHAHSEVGRYQVVIEHHVTHVVLLVVDAGQGFDPATIPPIGAVRQQKDGGPRYGGFGLQLIRALADRVDIQPSHPHGVTVRAEKSLTCVR